MIPGIDSSTNNSAQSYNLGIRSYLVKPPKEKAYMVAEYAQQSILVEVLLHTQQLMPVV